MLRHALGAVGRRVVAADNLPVLAAIVVPALLFILAWADVMDLSTAYALSIAWSLLALFALGLYEGRIAGESWAKSTVFGIAAGAIGVVVVLLESALD